MKLEGKTALVTGCARRVGRAIAMSLAKRGTNLAIHYNHSRKDAERLAAEMKVKYGAQSALFKADLLDLAQVQKLANAVLRQFGKLHVLVHNASIYEKSIFGKTKPAGWDRHLDVNLRTPFFLSQTLGTAMKKNGEGKIIHLADWSAHRPYVDYIPYCVSKAGLLCLNTALAKALAPEVQVNAIMPGPVLLPENDTAKMRRAVMRATLVKRLGSPEDIAKTVLFLIESSDFITGASLAVDGGRLIA